MGEWIAIIDCGSGNLRSAERAFATVAAQVNPDSRVTVTADAADVLRADRIVLPGQGAFASCMAGLDALEGMRAALEESVRVRARPFLGICVGMQVMATRGLEHGDHAGLGWIDGEVSPLAPCDPALKIPHMGWNTLSLPPGKAVHPVLSDVRFDQDHFYFVHSYALRCVKAAHTLALADYGGNVVAIAGYDTIIGVQFHPEKSQKAGLKLIEGFLRWRP